MSKYKVEFAANHMFVKEYDGYGTLLTRRVYAVDCHQVYDAVRQVIEDDLGLVRCPSHSNSPVDVDIQREAIRILGEIAQNGVKKNRIPQPIENKRNRK